MSECLITRRGGSGLPASVTYPIVAILTESGTWTVPDSGTYRISCIGSGAAGGWYTEANMPVSTSVGGGGGGAGGIAESSLKLSKGIAIEVTLNSGVTSFGGYLSATAGSAPVAEASVVYIGGNGGAGTGGNMGNYSGGNGTNGNTPNYSSGDGGSTNETPKFGGSIGGKGTSLHSSDGQALNPPMAYTPYGGFPYGAGGFGYPSSNYGSTVWNAMRKMYQPGAIIIERIK